MEGFDSGKSVVDGDFLVSFGGFNPKEGYLNTTRIIRLKKMDSFIEEGSPETKNSFSIKPINSFKLNTNLSYSPYPLGVLEKATILGIKPEPRANFGFCLLAPENYCLYGGENGKQSFNDYWHMCKVQTLRTSYSWTKIELKGELPSPVLSFHCLTPRNSTPWTPSSIKTPKLSSLLGASSTCRKKQISYG